MALSAARKGRMKSRSVVSSTAFFVDCLIVFYGWKWVIIKMKQVLPTDVFGRRSKADGMILQRFPIYQQDVFSRFLQAFSECVAFVPTDGAYILAGY